MNNLIKKNILKVKPSATLAINEKSNLLENKGKKIYKFGFGQSPFPIPESIVEELKKNAHKKSYLPVQGLLDLRIAISSYLNKKYIHKYDENNILVGPGTKELMLLTHIAFNGEILLPAPSWVSYEPQGLIAKNKIHWIQTLQSNNWFPTAKQIELTIKKIKNKNLILFLNSPNNPSGAVCKNLTEIAEVAKKYSLVILSDEIYSELCFNNNYDSISNYYPERTIISSGLSKWCGAGGWRLGYFVIPNTLKELKKSLKILCSESFSSVSAPIQYAAIKAFSGDHSKYLRNINNILSFVGNYVFKNLQSNKININRPQGGFYLFPEFNSKKFSSSKEMCDDILNKTGVAMLPGSDFGIDKTKLVARLSYTDFDGEVFIRSTSGSKNLDNDDLLKYAPNIAEGVSKIKDWSNSI